MTRAVAADVDFTRAEVVARFRRRPSPAPALGYANNVAHRARAAYGEIEMPRMLNRFEEARNRLRKLAR